MKNDRPLLDSYTLIEQVLRNRQPIIKKGGYRQAAVAMILRTGTTGLEMFFIERARHENDPWSGQIAFPGGGYEPEDNIVLHTALRETREEVGLALSPAMLIGRLDDQITSNHRERGEHALVISCFVFHLSEDQPVSQNYEVSANFWVPIAHLFDPRHVFTYYPRNPNRPFPGIRFEGGQVLWGLTYRFVEQLDRLLCH